MHSAVHRSIARVFASFTNKNREKNDTRLWTSEYSRGIFAFWFVRSFCFRKKKSIARNHRTFDFNLVPKFLSYPSLRSERERENGQQIEPGNEVGLISCLTYIPICTMTSFYY